MFSDMNGDVINIPSTWQKSRSKVNSALQTTPIIYYSKETGREPNIDTPTQTDEPKEPNFEVIEDSNPQKTAEFLRNVEPIITQAFQQNLLSHAFDGYTVSYEDTGSETICIFTLKPDRVPQEVQPDLSCTGVSWSSSGSSIAASYGRVDHLDLCIHTGMIVTWNIDRYSFKTGTSDSSNSRGNIIVTGNCAVAVSYHPKQNTLLAGGLFNGDVIVWDLVLNDEPKIATSTLLKHKHIEPISQLEWILKPGGLFRKSTEYLILSVSGDGLLFLWSMSNKDSNLIPMFRSNVFASQIPRNLRINKTRTQDNLGFTCFSVSFDDPNVLILGTENGNVLKCSLHSINLEHSILDVPSQVSNILSLAFTPHSCPVTSVSCSPFERNLFLSSSSDSNIHISSLIDSSPLFQLFTDTPCVLGVCWSLFRPAVFFTSTADGRILVYDLTVSRMNPVETLSGHADSSPILSIKLNTKRRQLLGSGNLDGTVRIWQLSSELCNRKNNEEKCLTNFAPILKIE